MESRKNTAATNAHSLYLSRWQGVLSTLSLSMKGFPFGSVVSFAQNAAGWPVMQISSIAEHTRNIDADPRVSLILTEDAIDAQDAGRITLVGNARRIAAEDEADAAERFFRRFPHAEAYRNTHDFALYAIEPLRIRFIGGFGQIHWLEPGAVCQPNPFPANVESDMAAHMNKDHAAALVDYCRMFGIDMGDATPRLSAIDRDGFDVMLGKRLARIPFDAPVSNADEVRKAMVALAMRARKPTADAR